MRETKECLFPGSALSWRYHVFASGWCCLTEWKLCFGFIGSSPFHPSHSLVSQSGCGAKHAEKGRYKITHNFTHKWLLLVGEGHMDKIKGRKDISCTFHFSLWISCGLLRQANLTMISIFLFSSIFQSHILTLDVPFVQSLLLSFIFFLCAALWVCFNTACSPSLIPPVRVLLSMIITGWPAAEYGLSVPLWHSFASENCVQLMHKRCQTILKLSDTLRFSSSSTFPHSVHSFHCTEFINPNFTSAPCARHPLHKTKNPN